MEKSSYRFLAPRPTPARARPDNFQAERVMSTLRQLAEDGHTVICSIHQVKRAGYGVNGFGHRIAGPPRHGLIQLTLTDGAFTDRVGSSTSGRDGRVSVVLVFRYWLGVLCSGRCA